MDKSAFQVHAIGEEALSNLPLTSWRCAFLAGRSTKTQSIPLYNILWAELSQDQANLTIDYAEEVSKTQLRVAHLSYPTTKPQNESEPPSSPTTDTINQWIETLLTAAYGPATRRKRAYVLINPHAGPGRAQTQWTQEVAPLFAAARMPTTVHTTTRSGEAIELARTMDIDAFDIVVPCGGDGGPHELFRGLGARTTDARRALATVAVAHVPCGSGNALACNTLGTPKAGPAALAIVKGVPTPVDLVSITQEGETRSLSFLSQTLGVMAEADLGTEHLRWMGEHRFTYGTVKQILKKKEYACDLWVKMEIETKEAIRKHYRRERENSADKMTTTTSTAESEELGASIAAVGEEGGLPPLKYGTVGDAVPEGWIKVDADHVGTFFAGNVSTLFSSRGIHLYGCVLFFSYADWTSFLDGLDGPRRELFHSRPLQRRLSRRLPRRWQRPRCQSARLASQLPKQLLF